MAIETWDYTCGAPIFSEDHSLYNIIFVRDKISCQKPMELTYYSCRKTKLERCYWCGFKEDLQVKPQHLIDTYQMVYPLCNNCHEEGIDFYCRLAKKTNISKRKR